MESSDKDAGWYPTEMAGNFMLVAHFIPETIPLNYEFWRKNFAYEFYRGDFLLERKAAKHAPVLGFVLDVHSSNFDYSQNKMEKVNKYFPVHTTKAYRRVEV